MKVFVKSFRGINKEKSEDRVLVGQSVLSDITASIELKTGKIVVADGVGGNNAGDVAANMVCDEIANVTDITVDSLEIINSHVLQRSFSNSDYTGMATTASGCVCYDNKIVKYFHIGNTRIYEIKAGMYLRQITVDDTVVEYLLSSGQITEEEALSYPARHEITACFGGGKKDLFKIKVEPEVYSQPTQLLITSDGVHEYISIDEMEDIICDGEKNWPQIIDSLVKSAIDNGSMDDCTAVIVDFVN